MENHKAQYRSAQPADIANLGKLFDEYRMFYRQASSREQANDFIRQRVENGDSRIILAILGDEIVGFTQLYPSFSSVSMKRLWILNDLYVVESARKHGAGRGLLSAASDFAKKDGAKGLILATEHSNVTAQALYEKFGFLKDNSFHHYYHYF